jgi:hypothetical protein
MTLANCITDELVGTKATRYGARPSAENLNLLRSRVEACLCEGRPIEAVTGWGVAKGYGQFDVRCARFPGPEGP